MKNRGNQPLTIDAPVGGLNLVSAPNRMPMNQARELTNYLCTDAGIQEFGGISRSAIGGGTEGFGIAAVQQIGGDSFILWSFKTGGVYQLRYCKGSIFPANSEVTYGAGAQVEVNAGAAAVSTEYAGYLFYFSGARRVIRVTLTTMTADLAVFTINGGGVDSPLVTATTYKSRLYAIENGTNKYHYSALAAITGAMTAVDLSGVFQSTSSLLAISNWTFNPGNSNDEYLVLLNLVGEILIYSGTDPGAANWGLVARLVIPAAFTRQPFVKVGGDLLVITGRGIISLSTILSGRGTQAASYISVSRGVKDQINGNYNLCFWQNGRLLVGVDGSDAKGIFCQNTETGAWSRIRPKNAPGAGGSNTFSGVAALTANLYAVETTTGEIVQFGKITSSEMAIWKTPFVVGNGQNQRINKVKIQGSIDTDDASDPGFRASAAIEVLGENQLTPATTTPTNYDTAKVSSGPAILECNLNIGGTGDEWSLVQWHKPVSSAGSQQTIYGANVWVEDTGSID